MLINKLITYNLIPVNAFQFANTISDYTLTYQRVCGIHGQALHCPKKTAKDNKHLRATVTRNLPTNWPTRVRVCMTTNALYKHTTFRRKQVLHPPLFAEFHEMIKTSLYAQHHFNLGVCYQIAVLLLVTCVRISKSVQQKQNLKQYSLRSFVISFVLLPC